MGSIVGILPAFHKINQASEQLRHEYLPPAYLHNGAIWIQQSDYRELQSIAPFPDHRQLPKLTPWEAAKLLQWETPHQILGDIYSPPTLLTDLVIASSEGSFLEHVPIFTTLIGQLLTSVNSITIRPTQPQEQIISFYLDLAGIPHWNAMAYDGKAYKLHLEPGYTCVMD